MLAIKYLSLITYNAFSFPELLNRGLYPHQTLAEAEETQQKSDKAASASTIPSTPPDSKEMFSSQANFMVNELHYISRQQ